MSRDVAALVYSRKCGSMLRKAVLAYFAERANDCGGGIWASKQRIADEIECSKQAVIKTVQKLVSEGIVIEAGKRKTQGGHTIVYDLCLDSLKALPPAKADLVEAEIEPNQSTEITTNESTGFTGQNMDRSTGDNRTSQPGLPKPSLEPITPVSSNEDTPPAANPNHLLTAWNAMAERTGLSKAKTLDDTRYRKAKSLIRKRTVDDITEAIAAVERSPFCRGENDRGWRADFDFLLQPKSFNRLIEGFYG